MSRLGMIRAAAAIVALLFLLLLASAWSGFPFGTWRSWLANAKANETVAVESEGSALTSSEELDKIMKATNGIQKRKEKALSGLSAAKRPEDNEEEASRHIYDAWRAGVAGVCPDCASEKLDDQPAQ